MIATLSIPATNLYAGTVDFRITSEATPGTIYGDGAVFQLSPIKAETNWHIDTDSVTEYGRIENVLLRGSMSNAAANAEVTTLLARSAWFRTSPIPNFSIGGSKQADKLTLTVCGYAHTLANKTVTIDGTAAMSDLVPLLVAPAEFVTLAGAQTNAAQFTIENRGPLTQWKVLSDIAAAGDANGNRWSLGVYQDRKLTYAQTNIDPQYAILNGKVYYINGGEADPRLIQPAMFRFDDMPIGPTTPYTAPINDPRYQYVDEVEFIAETGQLNFRQMT